MDYAGKLFLILLSTVLVNNFVLSRFLGICPFLECQKVSTAMGMGAAVTFVMTLASLFYLYNTICNIGAAESGISTDHCFYIGYCCASSICRDGYSKDESNSVSGSRRLPSLITTNCAVLGVAIINIRENYDLLQTLVNGAGAALGFT